MKIFLGIMSCHKNGELRQAQRDTWLRSTAIPYRFFLGTPEYIHAPVDPKDEIVVPVNDSHSGVARKSDQMIHYAYDHGAEFYAKTDDDGYVVLSRLLASGFEHHEFTGYYRLPAVAVRGALYVISRKCMKIVLDSNMLHRNDAAEDLIITEVLSGSGIKWHHDPRMLPDIRLGQPLQSNDIISTHNQKTPEDMRRVHREFVNSDCACGGTGVAPDPLAEDGYTRCPDCNATQTQT